MKKLTRLCGVSLSALLLVAGCGAPPAAETPATIPATVPDGGGTVAEANFVPCIISDGGTFDDASFNQSALEGMTEAANQLGISQFARVETSEIRFDNDLEELAGATGCTLITATGFLIAPAVVHSALTHPETHYLMVDHDAVIDDQAPPENIKTVLFDTSQAAFLAGYVAAAYSSREGGANRVGTFGGVEIPTVTIFMDGFRQGVEYYNEQHGTNVEVFGMNSFTGGFDPGPQALATAQGVVDQGVDVLMPVGGGIYLSGITAIHDSGRDIAFIGVDTDMFYSDPSVQPYILTSVLKDIHVAVRDNVLASAQGAWDPTPYVGTLVNGGVGIAPFHNFEDRIPQEVRDSVAQLREDIIAGRVHVESDFN